MELYTCGEEPEAESSDIEVPEALYVLHSCDFSLISASALVQAMTSTVRRRSVAVPHVGCNEYVQCFRSWRRAAAFASVDDVLPLPAIVTEPRAVRPSHVVVIITYACFHTCKERRVVVIYNLHFCLSV